MKKITIPIILSALILSSCGNTDMTDNSTSSAKATTAERSSVSQEKEEKSESSDTESLDRESSSELEYFAEIDESVSFDTYDDFADSDDLTSRLNENGVTLTELSNPIFNSDELSLNHNVTMYETCSYYSFTDAANDNVITVCLSFKQFNGYEEMKQFLNDAYNGGSGEFVIGEFSSDDENEIYTAKGNHTSYFRLSQDGLMYSIFCETISDEQLYSYCEKIKL